MAYSASLPLDYTQPSVHQENFPPPHFSDYPFTYGRPDMPVYSAEFPHQQSGVPIQDTSGYWHLPLPHQPMTNHVTASPQNGRPKRRRVATVAQRRAANVRERRRMFNLNESFDQLRTRVPTFAYEKRLSRIETLRLAITYISFLGQLIDGAQPDQVKLVSMPKSSEHARVKRAMDNEKRDEYYDETGEESDQ